MTKKEVVDMFYETYPEYKNPKDYWAAQFAWPSLTDALCKGGKITVQQYNGWLPPFKAPGMRS